jgi:2-amino-4-hydroxy-6-hydroxymethyldihydropteridine diphosphokinase
MNESALHKSNQPTAYPVRVYLGLGSNLGDRQSNLLEAVERINGLGLEVTRASSIYETDPVGYVAQPRFLNQVIEILLADDSLFLGINLMTRLEGMLQTLLDLEREMGRRRLVPDGPRIIDIDLLIHDRMKEPFISASGALILPHPRMHLRRFVLEPLCEIAPDLIHPTTKQTCRQMLDALKTVTSDE